MKQFIKTRVIWRTPIKFTICPADKSGGPETYEYIGHSSKPAMATIQVCAKTYFRMGTPEIADNSERWEWRGERGDAVRKPKRCGGWMGGEYMAIGNI